MIFRKSEELGNLVERLAGGLDRVAGPVAEGDYGHDLLSIRDVTGPDGVPEGWTVY